MKSFPTDISIVITGPEHLSYVGPPRPPTRMEALVKTLALMQLLGATRYKARDITGDGIPETFCNIWSADVSSVLQPASPLPRGLRANELYTWLGDNWLEVTANEAQAHANDGTLCFAVYKNLSGPGHIAPVCPDCGDAGIWVSHVGRTNLVRCTVGQAFGDLPVRFYVSPAVLPPTKP